MSLRDAFVPSRWQKKRRRVLRLVDHRHRLNCHLGTSERASDIRPVSHCTGRCSFIHHSTEATRRRNHVTTVVGLGVDRAPVVMLSWRKWFVRAGPVISQRTASWTSWRRRHSTVHLSFSLFLWLSLPPDRRHHRRLRRQATVVAAIKLKIARCRIV